MRFRQGFSFAEVMFAVAILGVGFIMIAAIFPVATEQTRATADEAQAAVVARAAFTIIQNSTHASDYNQLDGTTVPFCATTLSPLWDEIQPSTIYQLDPRYAWVPFYSKNGARGALKVCVLVVRRSMHSQYSISDLTGTSQVGELQPRGLTIDSIKPNEDGRYSATIEKDENPLYQSGAYQSLVPGCLLIITSGALSGQSYQLGQIYTQTDSTIVYELSPTTTFSNSDLPTSSIQAAVIGRDYVDAGNSLSGFDGPSQDVAVYTTFLSPD